MKAPLCSPATTAGPNLIILSCYSASSTSFCNDVLITMLYDAALLVASAHLLATIRQLTLWPASVQPASIHPAAPQPAGPASAPANLPCRRASLALPSDSASLPSMAASLGRGEVPGVPCSPLTPIVLAPPVVLILPALSSLSS